MISGMKRAAAQISGSTTGHGKLTMVLYQEKCVVEELRKMAAVKAESSTTLLKWAELEPDQTYNELYSRMRELDSLWLQSMQQYEEQYDVQRRLYKHILNGERQLDEIRKQTDVHVAKVSKAYKTLEAARKRSDWKKKEAAEVEYAKVLNAQDNHLADLQQREDNHTLFKYKKVKEALQILTKANTEYHERCAQITRCQQLLSEILLGKSYGDVTLYSLKQASQDASQAVNEVADKLGFRRPPNNIPDDMMEAVYQGLPVRSNSTDHDSDSEDSSPATSIKRIQSDTALCSSTKSSSKSAAMRPLPEIPGQRPRTIGSSMKELESYSEMYSHLPADPLIAPPRPPKNSAKGIPEPAPRIYSNLTPGQGLPPQEEYTELETDNQKDGEEYCETPEYLQLHHQESRKPKPVTPRKPIVNNKTMDEDLEDYEAVGEFAKNQAPKPRARSVHSYDNPPPAKDTPPPLLPRKSLTDPTAIYDTPRPPVPRRP